jgi:hypothetical protein
VVAFLASFVAYDHYISKSLTKPWRTRTKELHFFDFETETFELERWKKLHGKDHLNSSALETWLEREIETPLGKVRSGLNTGKPTTLRDPSAVRPAILMLMLQGLRTATAIEDEGSDVEQGARRHLEKIATMPPDGIDMLVSEIRRHYSIHLVFAAVVERKGTPLFVPSTGIFPVTFPDRGCASGSAVGTALPIHPTCALVAAPADGRGELELAPAAKSLAWCSVGTFDSKYVVVDPRLMNSTPQDELRRRLIEMRKGNEEMRDRVAASRAIIFRMCELFGFSVDEGLAGRLTVSPPGK